MQSGRVCHFSFPHLSGAPAPLLCALSTLSSRLLFALRSSAVCHASAALTHFILHTYVCQSVKYVCTCKCAYSYSYSQKKFQCLLFLTVSWRRLTHTPEKSQKIYMCMYICQGINQNRKKESKRKAYKVGRRRSTAVWATINSPANICTYVRTYLCLDVCNVR